MDPETRGVSPAQEDHSSDQVARSSKRRRYEKTNLANSAAVLSAMMVGCVLMWVPFPDWYWQEASTSGDVFNKIEEVALINSLNTVGAIAGSIPAGFISEAIGRRYTIIGSALLSLIALLITLFRDVASLYANRLISGFAVGVISVVTPMYNGEISEVYTRGSLGSAYFFSLCAGQLVMYEVQQASYIVTIFFLALIPAVYGSILFLAPDSPTQLMRRGRKDEARKSLKALRYKDHNIEKELQDLEKEIQESRGSCLPISDLICSPGPRKALTISIVLLVLQAILGEKFIFSIYVTSLFNSFGTYSNTMVTVLLMVQMLMGVFPASIIIDRKGRRIFLLASAVVMTLSLILLGVFLSINMKSKWPALLCVIVYAGAFTIGFGPVPWLMIGELFSVNVKWLGVSIAVCLYWTCRYVLYDVLLDDIYSKREDVICWCFAGLCAVGFIFVYFVVPETRRKNVMEIQQLLRKDRVNESNLNS